MNDPNAQTASLAERLRAICLALPEVTERPSHGTPTWFVRGKSSFVTLWCESPRLVSWTPCICQPAKEAAGRGRGMGHVRVECNRCHDQLRQTVFFEPPHDSGYRPLTGWVMAPDPQS